MWRVKLDGRTVYEPDNARLSAIAAELQTALSSPGELELQIPFGHALYSELASMPLLGSQWFTVERDGEEVWRGRLVQRNAKPLDGVMILLIEGELGLLNDSVMEPYAQTGTPRHMLTYYLNAHNAQVDSWKRIYTGRVQVADVAGTGNITREASAPVSMMQEVLEKTCNSSTGGYLMLRRSNGKRYLDWVSDPAVIGAQPIKTAYNLLACEDVSDGGDFHTAVYATGAQVQDADGEYRTLTLDDLPDRTDQGTAKVGPLMINTDLQAKHGIIAKVVSWNDVTEADNLYTRARQYARSLSEPRTVEVNAVDMSLTGSGVAPFSIGQRVPVETPTFEGSALVTGVTYDIIDPSGGSVTFGDINAQAVDAGDVVAVKTTGSASQVSTVTQQVQQQQQTIARLVAQSSGGGSSTAAPVIPHGALDGTSTSTVMTATVQGVNTLKNGTCCYIDNGVVTSAAGVTLDVNGLGAKPLYSSQAAATAITTQFNVAYTAFLIYNETRVAGGCWDYVYGFDSNSNTIGYQLRTNSSNKVASDTGYRYRLWFTSADGSKWVPANTSTSTNATSNRTLNTRAIDPFGPIVYRATNGTCTSGSGVGATGIWQQYTLTIGYSYMQSGFSLTAQHPVYLKATPQADGSAVMSSIVQTLPSSNDGCIYILLGTAYSTTAMELQIEHPVYWHDGTGLRIWTGASSANGDTVSTVDGWTVETRADGIIEATKTLTGSLAVTSSYAGQYISAAQSTALPSGVFTTIDWGGVEVSYSPGLWDAHLTSLTTSAIGYYIACNASTTANITRRIYVRGR